MAGIKDRLSLNGRNYIVTGGAMGIGYAITHDIAEMGGNVAVLDLRPTPPEPVHDLPKKFGIKTDYFQCDVSDEASLTAAFEQAVQSLGTIDGIVTAAGIAIDKPFETQKWEEVDKILQVNGMGSFFAAQLAVKQMKKQQSPGSIVFIASITSHVNLPGYRMAGYNMSKGGIRMVAKALSAELAPAGIRVNSVSPAFIETNQTKTARDHTTQAAGELMNTAPPLGRIGSAYDVSPAVVYLLSDAAAYTTGSDILVSGGIHTGRGGDYDMCNS
ncbi:NAD(P)-binding protein [Teratosphaeria destructans]|uniref:NAD(P)-binding protein n=1 Tax=Teratosphaeria destructans TaxID=418781 RepID=A0A9W7W068_9PEZI|nr:NAD(P)-binding protein [Teratosphaeria destructans]